LRTPGDLFVAKQTLAFQNIGGQETWQVRFVIRSERPLRITRGRVVRERRMLCAEVPPEQPRASPVAVPDVQQ
jgi:hypothetical protein